MSVPLNDEMRAALAAVDQRPSLSEGTARIIDQMQVKRVEETAALLKRCADRSAKADELEARALVLVDMGDIRSAADCFTVAAGLRGRARVLP